MRKKRTSMRKIKEILRLSLKEKFGQRKIAQSTGVGKTTIQEIISKAKNCQLTWENIEEIHEDALSELLYLKKYPTHKEETLPNWSEIKLELMKKENTLILLWNDYTEAHPTGLKYSRFCSLYSKWEKESRLTLRQNHIAGDKLFVDFSGLRVPWIDEITGEIHEAEIFVATLGASNYTFIKATPNQTMESWIYAHCDALQFFGGVPNSIVPDNLKSGVTKACRYDPDLNPTYHSLATHYDTAIMPTRAYKPRDKAKVEVAVQIVQRWILAILRRQTFSSIYAINEAIKPLLEKLNNKKMKYFEASRKELWERFEKPNLKSLPQNKFEIPMFKNAKVNIDYHVEFQNFYYSVPYKYVGIPVLIKATKSILEIFYKNELIATHAKTDFVNPSGRHVTIAEHMPKKHDEYLKWTPERISNWAQNSGSNTRLLCEQIIKLKPIAEQGFRSCLGIMRLGDKYDKKRLDLACKIAMEKNQFRYKEVEIILKYEKDKIYLKKQEELKSPQIPVPTHENIRGSQYYS